MKFWNFFKRKQEQDFVAAKLGIITICRHCHKKIHLEDEKLHRSENGMLDEEDGYNVWIHDKSKRTYCAVKNHFLYEELRFAEPMETNK